MKPGIIIPNILIALLLAFVPLHSALSQTEGTYPPSQSSQPGTSSQPAVAQPPTETGSADGSIEAGIGNTAQPVAQRSVGWGWFILGLLVGLIIGAVAWRRPAVLARRSATVIDYDKRRRVS